MDFVAIAFAIPDFNLDVAWRRAASASTRLELYAFHKIKAFA
jgi:hypothetical protein